MKLLFVVNSLDFFVSHRLEIALAAQKQNYEIHIFTFSKGDESKILKRGLNYHNIEWEDGTKVETVTSYLIKFVLLISLLIMIYINER